MSESNGHGDKRGPVGVNGKCHHSGDGPAWSGNWTPPPRPARIDEAEFLRRVTPLHRFKFGLVAAYLSLFAATTGIRGHIQAVAADMLRRAWQAGPGSTVREGGLVAEYTADGKFGLRYEIDSLTV